MTKEEYETLLQSDYWKGYSYSLIKERNFTCEDCGRSFPNMRNMLQVHHLVYRDANPWSYNPEELIVLCKECHQKRHGIHPDAVPDLKEEETKVEDNATQSYTNTYTEEMSKRYAYDNSPIRKRNWLKFVVLAYVIMCLLYLVLKSDPKEQMVKETPTPVETSISDDVVLEELKREAPPVVKKKTPSVEQKKNIAIESVIQPGLKISQEANTDSKTNEMQKPTIDLPKEKKRTNVEKKRSTSVRPKKTSDIWEKVNRRSF